MILEMDLSFVEKLAVWRKRRGLSQNQLAIKAGVARNSIAMLERGETNPTIEQLEKIVRALELELVLDVRGYETFTDLCVAEVCEECGLPKFSVCINDARANQYK